jgi:hypothetical protein
MPQRTNIRIDGKIYIFVASDAKKEKLTSYVDQLKGLGYLVRVAKITNDAKGLPPDGLEAYKKDFPHGRWGVWVHKKVNKK